ncbi:MAG TPA: hypothetical protein VJ553_02190, partial [Candidatus Paceibacterota bacterium]|nr:hypothetical protein [Candidatus Paceibacterota bacterium]
MGHRTTVPARIMRIFEVGRRLEDAVVENMRSAGILDEASPQLDAVYTDPPIVGRIDCIIKRPGTGVRLLVEIKSISDKRFDNLPPGHGFTPASGSSLMKNFRGYLAQWNVYAWAPTVNIERGLILF